MTPTLHELPGSKAMIRDAHRRRAMWSLAAAILVAASGYAAESKPTVTWRIAFDGGADDHGEIVLSYREAGVEVTQVEAAIPKGTPENAVADRVRRALRRAMPKSVYEIDLRGGEQIFVAAQDPAKDYEIRLVRNTVPGTEVTVERLKSED
jgi:hypothetical protein